MSHPPTEEQAHCIELARADPLVIQAGAGTGKTSTLVMIAEDRPKTLFQFLAFNKSIADDAGAKFPPNVYANTVHSMAHTGIVKGTGFAKRLGAGAKRMSPFDVARILGCSDISIMTPGGPKRLSAGYIASLALATVGNFCRTADVKIGPWHVPTQKGLDEPTADGSRGPMMRELASQVAPYAEVLWRDISNPDGRMPFEHGHYLKLWQLSNPKIQADVLFLDEAQDLNPCMMSIAEQQAHMRLIVVGDSQQSIYGWNGAVDALDQFDISNTAWLTQSFRFGPAVAEVANEILALLNAPLRLRGFEPRESVVTSVRDGVYTYLGRTNGSVIRQALMGINSGQRVAIVGDTAKQVISFAKAAQNLKDGKTTHHHDLACFRTWAEVQDYVEHDPLGEELRLMVRIVDEFGVDTLIRELQRTATEKAADLICSTAHKAKGREWDRVLMGNDFTDPEKREVSDEEKRLTYVGVTRAMLELDVASVPILKKDQPANLVSSADNCDAENDAPK